ncbi:MAG: hypothetical protein OXC28_13125 [Defluviicoccus sp.]|nr:hypothetical protein [Defluviicoccus sp.]
MRQSLLSPPRGNRPGFQQLVVVAALIAAITLLSDIAFAPWQYDRHNAQASSLPMVPRVAIMR